MSDDIRNILRASIRNLLRPVLRLCIAHSFRIQELEDMLKSALLELGEEELQRQAIEANVSRLSALTGLHRRDVRRLWKHEFEPRTDADVIARVIGQWQSDKRFLTANGRPKNLPLRGGERNFIELVKLVSSDLNPYTVLFELERTGSAKLENEEVKLIRTSLAVGKDLKAGLALLTADSRDLLQGVSENLFEEQDQPNLHLRTEYTNIPAGYADQIRLWFLERGAEFHAVVRAYLAKLDRDINPSLDEEKQEGTIRVSLTTFSLTREEPAASAMPRSTKKSAKERSSGKGKPSKTRKKK
jgi:hypothetical protein